MLIDGLDLLANRTTEFVTHTHATTAMKMTTMMTVWLVEWNARSERLEACMEVLEGYVLHIMYNHKKLSLCPVNQIVPLNQKNLSFRALETFIRI